MRSVRDDRGYNQGWAGGRATAGELVDCLRAIRRYYPRVASDELKVTLLQDLPRLLPELSERLGRSAHASLARRGVDVRVGLPETSKSRAAAKAAGLVVDTPAAVSEWADVIRPA